MQAPQSASSSENQPQRKDYIGCQMSLISKQEIRYVGTLVAINSRDQTLVLQNVKSYGSENRRGGSDEVPASDQIYERVMFRAAELKDFYVIKSPEKDFKDPAIISTEKAEKKEAEEHKEEIKERRVEQPTRHYRQSEEEWRAPPREARGRGRVRYNRYRRGNPRRTEGLFQQHSVKELQEKYEEDYAFEEMNKKFESLFKENVEVDAKYDKEKSFYDSLSRGKEDKAETPYDRHKQRQIDADTFDLDPQYHERRGGYNYRGRYQGRYRRGRGYQYGRRGQQNYRRRGYDDN